MPPASTESRRVAQRAGREIGSRGGGGTWGIRAATDHGLRPIPGTACHIMVQLLLDPVFDSAFGSDASAPAAKVREIP